MKLEEKIILDKELKELIEKFRFFIISFNEDNEKITQQMFFYNDLFKEINKLLDNKNQFKKDYNFLLIPKEEEICFLSVNYNEVPPVLKEIKIGRLIFTDKKCNNFEIFSFNDLNQYFYVYDLNNGLIHNIDFTTRNNNELITLTLRKDNEEVIFLSNEIKEIL